LEPELEDRLYRLAAAVFRVTGCKDVARVDFRLDTTRNNQPYILEVNPLPGLNPVTATCVCRRKQRAGL